MVAIWGGWGLQGVESSAEVLYESIPFFYLLRSFPWINECTHIICRKPVPEEKVWKSKDTKKKYFLARSLSQTA